MAAFTDNAENKLIDWLFRAQAIGLTGATAAAGTGPATLYIGLFTTTPSSDANMGVEPTIGTYAYARVAVTSGMGATGWAGTQAAASTTASSGTSGTTSNNGIITFPTPTTAGWGTVVGVGVWLSASGTTAADLLAYSALTTSKVINVGDSVTFPAASLTFQLDN